MQTDVIVGAAIGAAIGVVAGIPISLLGQRYVVAATRERRELGYEVLSSNVIIPKLPKENSAVRLSVKRAVLGNTLPDNPDEFVDVNEVYGFRVLIRNSGNRELVGQPVTFQFPTGTKIILADFEDAPEFGGQSAEVQTDNGSSQTTVSFPFLNPTDEVKVSIQTVQNASLDCRVIAAAPGLTVYDLSRRRRFRMWISVASILLFGCAIASTLVGLSLSNVFAGDTDRSLRLYSGLVLYITVGLCFAVGTLPFRGRFLKRAIGR